MKGKQNYGVYLLPLFLIGLLIVALSSFLFSCSSSSGGSSSNIVSNNLTIKTYSVGNGPSGIAIDVNGAVWVANTMNTPLGTVSEIIPSTGAILTYTVGSAPKGLVIDQASNIWVANTNNDTPYLSEIKSTGTVVTYTVQDSGSYPPAIDSIAISKDGDIWGVDFDNNILFDFSHSIDKVITTYPTEYQQPSIISLDANNHAWIGYSYSNTGVNALSEVDLATGNTISSYTISPHPYAIAIDQKGNVWVRCLQEAVYEISPTTGSEISYTVWTGTGNIAIDSAGNVWVPNVSRLTEINLATGSVITSATNVGNNIDGIAIDKSGDIWLVNAGNNTVSEIMNIAKGPQYFPYQGPQWPTDGGYF